MLSHIPAALPSTAHRPSVVGVRGQQGSKQLIEKKKCSGTDAVCIRWGKTFQITGLSLWCGMLGGTAEEDTLSS